MSARSPSRHGLRAGRQMVEGPRGGRFEIEVTPARQPAGAPPLVLIPGIGGPRGTFHHQVRALSANRDVVATNLNPTVPAGASSVDSSARDALQVMDLLGIAQADVLGASFGSCVTCRLGQLAPSRLRRQIWVAPPVVHHGPWRSAFGPGWLLGGALMKFAPQRYRPHVVRYLAENRVYSVEPDLSEDELHLLAGRVSDTDFSPFFKRLAGLREWDWRAVPGTVSHPTLVVQGRTEHEVTPRDVLEAWNRVSDRPVAVMPGHHMPYLSFPEEFNRIATGFLA